MKSFCLKKLAILTFLTVATTPVKADGFDWLKGCVLLGSSTAGGAALAVSLSGTQMTNSEGMLLAGITGCVIGGFLVGDVVRKAEMKTEGELRSKRDGLKMSVFRVQHDLRVLKGESGPDGEPYADKQGSQPASSGTFVPLKSGN